MKRSRYFFKNFFLIALNSIGTRIIVFFLVPLYTNVLTTREYGIVDLFSTILVVMIPIATLNIGEAVMRFSMDKNAPYDDIGSIAITFMFFSVLLCICIYPVLHFFPKLEPYRNYLFAYAAVDCIFQTTVYNLRGRELLKEFAVCNIIQTLLIALLNILFLVHCKIGLKGYFLSYTIANGIGALYAIWKGELYRIIRKYKFNVALAKQMTKYSIVLVPNSFMWWIMNSSDRIMVTNMLGVDKNGIYGISYKIPTIMSTLAGVFNQAWNYTAVRECDSEDRDSLNSYIYSNLLRVELILIAGIVLILKPFMSVYVSEEFYSSWEYIPPLIIGFGFMTASTFLSSAYTVHKDSKGFLYSGTIGAITNIVLNFILIPKWGIMGAAIATCISYISVFIYRQKDTKRYMHLKALDNSTIVSIIIVFIMCILIYRDNSYISILESIMFIIVIIANKDFFAILLRYLKSFYLGVKNVR